MRFNIYFTKPNVNIPINNQKELNSFIHRCLGKDNKYHDTFSDYSISSLQGGKYDGNNSLIFTEEPYITVSSLNFEFIGKMMYGVQFNNEKLFDMTVLRIEPLGEFNVRQYFDKVVTISPILLKNIDRKTKLTIKDDLWLERLNEQSKNKLKYIGIEDETFHIEIRNKEKAKTKNIHVGEVFNPSTMISLEIYGKPNTRIALYNLGLGNSTGSGFGAIKVYENEF